MIAAMLSAMAGNPDKLFDEFKNHNNAEYVSVPRFLLWAARATGSMKDMPMAKKVKNIKVLTLSNRDSKLTTRFEKRLSEETGGFDDLVKTTEDGEKVRIFTHIDGKKLENIYIYTTDRSESTFICMKGKFTADDISEITRKK